MKLYTYKPPYLIRINIKRQGEPTYHITVCDTTLNDAKTTISNLILAQNLNPFTKGKVTNIEFREGEGKNNGKSISISFKGMSPKEVFNFINNYLK